jgi:hypothetical protein
MTVAQQERAIHEVPHAGQLVRGDDRRDAALPRFVYGAMQRDGRSRRRGIIDQHDVVSARRGVRGVRRAGGRQETRELAVLDRARVDTAEASETLEQSGRAGTTSTEYGEAFSLVHLEAGGAKYPDARRASGDAGSVALPQGMGAKGERHERKDASNGWRADIDPLRPERIERARCLASGVPRGIIREPQCIDATSGGSPCRWKELDRPKA